jgi:hypothetical protein
MVLVAIWLQPANPKNNIQPPALALGGRGLQGLKLPRILKKKVFTQDMDFVSFAKRAFCF